VHVLLAGPPALAKSLFLWDLELPFLACNMALLRDPYSLTDPALNIVQAEVLLK